MGDSVCWLITIFDGDSIVKCGIKIKRKDLSEDCVNYPMELSSRRMIHSMLPVHLKEIGKIVAIESLFDVCVIGEGKEE